MIWGLAQPENIVLACFEHSGQGVLHRGVSGSDFRNSGLKEIFNTDQGAQFHQAIGRSRGGLTTKIHAVVDGPGNPVRIMTTGGNVHDIIPACEMISGIKADHIPADKAYDAEKFICFAQSAGCEIVVPPKSNRIDARYYDKHMYRQRHLVECFFAKLKIYRSISNRYEKLAQTFRAVILIAACLVWLQ